MLTGIVVHDSDGEGRHGARIRLTRFPVNRLSNQGLVRESAPRAPHPDRQHFCRTQHRRPAPRSTRQELSLELGWQCFEVIINGDIEREQGVWTAYLLLDSHRCLREGVSRLSHSSRWRCSSIFAGNRVTKDFWRFAWG